MAYGLRIRPSALKEMQALPDRERLRVTRRIDALSADPRPPGCARMAGGDHLYRVRAGDYRVLYAVDDPSRTVTVEKVGHRGDVYRRR